MQAFLHGIILAFGLILPLGVQNLFVFNQGANQPSFLRALPVVATASVCDTLLIVLAVQGVSVFILKFGLFKLGLIGIGVAFLAYMGWITWNNTEAALAEEPAKNFSAKQQIVFSATVSLLNPHAVMDTIGVIGTSSINYDGDDKLLFTMACVVVSWFWFFSLALAGRIVGSQSWFAQGSVFINRISAVFMWGSAGYMLYTAL